MQWGMNKGVSPYAFGANINGSWYNLGTVSLAGAWGLLPSTIQLGSAPTIPTGFTTPLATFESAYPGNTASADPFRFDTGGFPINNEFFGNPTVTPAGWHGIQSLVGTIKSPVGATTSCGGAPCQDVAVAGYAQTLEPTRAAVAIFGEGGIGVDGGYPFGANFVAVNCKNHDSSCVPGSAYNVTQGKGIEVDVVAFNTSSGTPTGTFYGYEAVLNRGGGTGQTTSIAFAVDPLGSATSNWQTGFQCSSGGSVNCLTVGATAATGTSKNSQPISFVSLNSSGTPLTNTLYQNSVGDFQFNNNAGSNTVLLAQAYPQIQLIGGANTTVGQKISTSATTGATANFILQTGTANNYLSQSLTDTGNYLFTAGSHISQTVFQMGSGPTNVFTLTPTTATIAVPLFVGSASTTTGTVSLANASSANLTSIQAGNASAAVTYTLPTAAPAGANYALISGITGTMSWASPATLINLTPGVTPTAGGAAGQLMYDTGSVLQESANLVFASNTLTVGKASTATGALTLANSGSAFTASIQSGANTPASWTLTLPLAVPAANGAILTATTAGVSSWTSILPVANGGTNCSVASITCFNNITGYTATGATGTTSTNLVFSTSPTITTPTISGNETHTGTAARFIADFDNATVNSRFAFQTSTTNATTGIYALPNGTSTAASWQATNNSDPTNASKILIATNASTDVQLVSGINGTGTYLPLSIYTSGGQSAQFGTTKGTLTLGVNATATGQLGLANGGATGATVTVQNNGATTAYNFNLPTTVGTAGYLLTSQSGGTSAMTWTSPTTTVNGTACTLGSTCTVTAAASSLALPVSVTGQTAGGIAYFNASNQMASSGALTANSLVIGGGTSGPSVTTTGTGVLTALGLATNATGGIYTYGTTLPSTMFPALTGDVTTTAGSLATTVGKIGGNAVSLGGAFTMSGAFTFTGTLSANTAVTFPTSGTLATTAGTVASFSAGTTGFTPSTATTGAVTLAGTLGTANGGTNCSVTSITCFNNITGFTAAGTTGTTSTNLVFSTSPTLVTPILGAATGTSLALGGATIGTNALAVTGTTALSSTLTSAGHVITDATANALAVGANGSTGPALKIDASTTTPVTGLQVKAGANTGGLALSLISNGASANENLTIDAKGTGTITLGSVSTGNIIHTNNSAFGGYLRVGSTSAPVNTTAGDITGGRLSIGNGDLAAAGGLMRVEGNIGSATAGSYGMYYAPTLTNSVNLTNTMYGFLAYPATNMTGGAGNNTVTQFAAVAAGFQNPTAGTITNAFGFWATSLLNQAGITNSYGFRCDMTAGNCFYNSNTAASNVFAGKTAFGTTTAATYNVDVTGDINSTANYRVAGKVSISATAPTFTSGFNTNGTISANNGTSAFRVTVGSGAAGSTGVIGMPTASTGWNCFASDITNPAANLPRVSAASTTSITLTNYNGANPPVATNWTNGDVIQVSCFAY